MRAGRRTFAYGAHGPGPKICRDLGIRAEAFTVVEPDPTLSHAANFLWMLNGEKPSVTATRTLDIALVLHADHELNASTFAARVRAIGCSARSCATSILGAVLVFGFIMGI